MAGQRGFLAVVAGIIALLILTVGVVLVRGDRPAASFGPGTPEAAVQAYLVAWDAGDDRAAWAAFSARTQAGTALDAYTEQAQLLRVKGLTPDASRQVFIASATVSGDSATVPVTVETTSVGGMSVNRYRQTITVPLVRENGAWRIDQLLMGTEPWFVGK
jgi:hypothetical protein